MNRSIELHPTSILAGAAGVILFGVLAGMAPQQAAAMPDDPHGPQLIKALVDMRHIPEAKARVRVVEGKPFVVPEHLFLVLTEGGFREFAGLPPEHSLWILRFDGKQVLKHVGGPGTHVRFPSDIVARPGTRVDLIVKDPPDAPNVGIAFGYLQAGG